MSINSSINSYLLKSSWPKCMSCHSHRTIFVHIVDYSSDYIDIRFQGTQGPARVSGFIL